MSNREEFSIQTKRAVALRAGYICSFPNCRQHTVGPSDEASDAITSVGDAAHICAAAPGQGARRYVDSMTSEQRTHIDNAIWMCATHARLIDRDEGAYTIDNLRQMKRDHEAAMAQEVRQRSVIETFAVDLIALGPDIVCTGEFVSTNGSEWTLRLRNFVSGDFHSLVAFIDGFREASGKDRYILVNELGDGRELATAPTMTKSARGYTIQCPVAPSFPRIAAQNLPTDLSLSESTNDLLVKNGNIATVRGLNALPQKLRLCLSIQEGEHFFSDFGTRLAFYYDAFHNSPWLGQMLKLEVIRMAAIPYRDNVMKRSYTPLQCVTRVRNVEVLAEAPQDSLLPVRLDLDIQGVGRWLRDISVFVPQRPSVR